MSTPATAATAAAIGKTVARTGAKLAVVAVPAAAADVPTAPNAGMRLVTFPTRPENIAPNGFSLLPKRLIAGPICDTVPST